MAIYNSKLMESFASGGRVRTINHRGSLLSSIAEFPKNNPTNDATRLGIGDIIPIMPIPYKSMVRAIGYCGVGTGTTGLTATLDLYGLKKDGKSIDTSAPIKTNIFSVTITLTGGAVTMTAPALGFDVVTKSIYNLLCEDKVVTNPDGTTRTIRVPISAFEPYKEDRFGILALTVTAAATAGDMTSKGVLKAEFVEAAPSSGPYMNTIGISPKSPSAI